MNEERIPFKNFTEGDFIYEIRRLNRAISKQADRIEKAINFIEDSVIYTYSETYEEYEFDYSLDQEQVFELLEILKGE